MKMLSNWSNAIAHVDCDAFYASCEAARHPELKGSAICVLSSQDAIVVAKSYAAKALGVTTGMPVWEAKKIAPQVVCLAADFRYYGQVSGKLFAILRRYSPDVEVYSIDEGFMDMSAVPALWHQSFQQLADEIRLTIACETGITASVGIATTRTLAKMASESNKPNGTMVVRFSQIVPFLHGIAVSDIPGIGRNRAAQLNRFNIHTALEFSRMDELLMQQLLGRSGMVLKQELTGFPVLGIETEPPLPKSVSRTASMGQQVQLREVVSAHLSYHTMRLVSELVAKQLLARHIHLFLTLASYEKRTSNVCLDVPTNSLKRITIAVRQGMKQMFRRGESYRACGVVATRISSSHSQTPDLFGLTGEDERQTELMSVVNRINKKYGTGSVSLAAVRLIKQKKIRPRFQYPLLIAH